MITTLNEKLQKGQDLSFEESEQAIQAIMSGQESEVDMATFLTALAEKGEQPVEIAGAANAMRKMAKPFTKVEGAVDIVGTGGDHSNSFNISSTTSLVLASLGYNVVKHGNRAATSKSGAADVLEALGINIHQDQSASEAMLKKHHFTFLFAQDYHPVMKVVAPVRSSLERRTIFNLLGPLANPARPDSMVLGVADEKLLRPLAEVLKELGMQRANVIFGTDGLDESSISAPTKLLTVRDGQIDEQTIQPEDFGLERADKEEIIGGTAAENADITLSILNGERGARRDIVVLNAGIAVNAANPEYSIEEGIRQAEEAIDSGETLELLKRIAEGN
ncbi:anthranilate phosphoribosyltransferase [Fructobacillus sp. CRL 2054]|uniref:anthranilate phosphoribosyltransferase n=1 Tax=Fructobacillus sp. CRL 2054 TaxID=2763007 RepID=UPI002378C169|nr:anthranilate phosphoribosyltransferase [Fructobacillus sp. CRL 2054]MDD9138734.1 anthranilate phosphoribosyltransferase [Fructobacillus sp. CRL 2054]